VRATELVLAAASVVAVCAVLEVGLRVRDWREDRGSLERALSQPVRLRPDGKADLGGIIRLAQERRRIYEFIPNTKVVLQNWLGGGLHTPLELNADGFRDREYAKPKPPGVRRIVGIGDSYMFGWGVRTGKDYLAVLETRLAAEVPGVRWEVLNMAVPGYNTAMEVETLRARGLAYEPDVVVVGFCWNDIDLPNFVRAPAEYLSLRRLFLADFVRGRLTRAELVTAPRGDGPIFASDTGRVPEEYRDLVGWGAFEAALDELAALGREHGFEVMFLAFEPDGVGGPIRSERRRRGLAEAVQRGFTIVDVGALQADWMRRRGMPAYYGSTLTLSGIDEHPSVLSHWLAADLLLQQIRAR